MLFAYSNKFASAAERTPFVETANKQNPIGGRLVYADWLGERGATKEEKELRDQVKSHHLAVALHLRLCEISHEWAAIHHSHAHVPRSMERKEFAKVVRKFFQTLGLKGISVVTPNYSMAQGIEIYLPAVVYSEAEQREYDNRNRVGPNKVIYDAIALLLDTCFPNHGDRSDYQTEHYSYKWTIYNNG